MSNGMKLSEELVARGFIHQTSGELSEIVDGEKRIVYHGIDPSADSAHAGNFVQWILLRHLAQAGHSIIFLVGGATGRIGDPKPDAERTLLPEEVIESNVAKIKTQAESFIGTGDITFVNNYDWFKHIKFIDFLRDIGKHFSVNELMKKDAIANRLASDVGLSYTEFAYPLIQGYDYLKLYRSHGCNVQTGGSDQWGNIVAGVDLVRRKEQQTVYAITQPLVIDKTTGQKFGKSEGNAVWLDASKTSPYQFYQFWLNTADENVVEFLKRFTFTPLADIKDLVVKHEEDRGERIAQKHLAKAVTTLVHGEEITLSVEKASQFLFGGGNISDLSAAEMAVVIENAPITLVTGSECIVDVLVESALAKSKREARMFVEEGAISINGDKVQDADMRLDSVLFHEGVAFVKRGKKQLSVLRLR